MNKKIIGLITTILMLFNVFCSFSIVGENVNTTEKLDDYNVNVSCDNNSMTVYPFETAVYGVEVTNTGNLVDTYILDCPDLIDCCYWSSLSVEVITLNPGEEGIVVLTVEPYYIEEATYTITVRATSTSDPSVNDSVPTFTTVVIDDRVIDVSTDKPIYYSGEPVVLSLKNIADVEIEGNPTLEVFNEDHELVYGCYPDCWINLSPGESFNHEWIPNVLTGKYTVEGIFITYEEEYFDDESFYILENNIIEVTTDNKTYESGELVNLRLKNIGESIIDGNPSFLIYNLDGELIYEVFIYLWIELEPDETFQEIWWDQKDKNGQQVPDGGYRLIGQLATSENKTYIDDYWFSIGENLPPNPPIIIGPTHGKVFVEYEYTFIIIDDPEGDPISLRVDWGIGGPGKLYGPFPPGTHVKLKYAWRRVGTFTIKAQTVDPYGESEWITFKVTISRIRIKTNPFFLQFLERYPTLEILLNICTK